MSTDESYESVMTAEAIELIRKYNRKARDKRKKMKVKRTVIPQHLYREAVADADANLISGVELSRWALRKMKKRRAERRVVERCNDFYG